MRAPPIRPQPRNHTRETPEPQRRARVIGVEGKVDGDLYATEWVNIRATEKVKGNVFAPRVGIVEGAFFQGEIEMQPSGAAVQEHSARLRQAALSPPLDGPAVDQMLGSS